MGEMSSFCRRIKLKWCISFERYDATVTMKLELNKDVH